VTAMPAPAPAPTRSTPSLYDAGEEAWPIKLHLGCGGVYLTGYINIDADACGQLAGVTPREQIERNRTTIDDYYARAVGTALALPQRRSTIYDSHAEFVYGLDYAPNTVYKILAIQCFDHLSPVKALDALSVWRRMLRPGGVLIMTVPDMPATLDLIETGNAEEREFGLRHLRGPQRDQWGYHIAWYTPATLLELLQSQGYAATLIDNPHFYPAIAVHAVKMPQWGQGAAAGDLEIIPEIRSRS